MSSYAPPPIVPPHPTELYHHHGRQQGPKPPPVPPLPPNFQPDSHLVSPMPERILPNMPADITQTLDNAAGYMSPPPPGAYPARAGSFYPPPNPAGPYDSYGRPSPAPPAQPGYPGGFARPQSAFAQGPPARYGPSPAPPPPPGSVVYASPPPPPPHQYQHQHQHQHQHPPYPSPTPMPMPAYSGYSSPPPPVHQIQGYPPSLNQAMDNLSLHARPSTVTPHSTPSSSKPPTRPDPQSSSYIYAIPPGVAPPPNSSQREADTTAPIPTKDLLLAAQRTLPPSPGIVTHLPWIRDLLFFVEHTWGKNNELSGPPVIITSDEVVRDLALRAAKLLQSFLPVQQQQPSQLSPPAEALYLRGNFHALGCAPEVYPKSAREAFRDWEASARAGWPKAWWRVGREYESTGDIVRAKECFERGMKSGVESCFYRMGMAKLLGQLGLTPNPGDAMLLLHKAATLSSIENAHPAYMYGLLLLGEFAQVKVEPRDFIALIPQGSSPTTEARKYIERAAYLHFAPAQYKLGHAYEYALPPFPYDPLLSVQYYSLASQTGEPEADMALSKWFLCGAEGAFEKDEALAVVFAEKAARKALPSAEFAMGYYYEVGVGVDKDVQRAITWYEKAVAHGNADASGRLDALKKDANQVISRVEHDKLTDAKLVRRRTQAKMDAVADGRIDATGPPLTEAQKVKAQALAAQASTAPTPPALSGPPQQQPQYHPPPQAQQRPPPQSQQQPQYNPNAPRYSLSDGPSPSSSPSPGSHLHAHPSNATSGRPAGKPPGRRHDNVQQVGQGAPGSAPAPAMGPGPGPGPQGRPPPGPQNAPPIAQPPQTAPQPGPPKVTGHGPATFAEMGFQVGKAEDKDCKVM